MKDYLTMAIQSLRPGSEYSYWHNDYSTIKWHVLEGEEPTKAEIDAEIEKIKASEATAEADRIAAKNALLERLGITSEEASLLLS